MDQFSLVWILEWIIQGPYSVGSLPEINQARHLNNYKLRFLWYIYKMPMVIHLIASQIIEGYHLAAFHNYLAVHVLGMPKYCLRRKVVCGIV